MEMMCWGGDDDAMIIDVLDWCWGGILCQKSE